MNKGKSYGWSAIMKFAEENDYDLKTLGLDVVGESFIVLTHEHKDLTISFVLSGATGHEYIYYCVYNSKEVPTLP